MPKTFTAAQIAKILDSWYDADWDIWRSGGLVAFVHAELKKLDPDVMPAEEFFRIANAGVEVKK